MLMIITRVSNPDSVCLRWPTGQMCSRPRWSLLYLCHGHHIIKFIIIKCDHQPSVNIHFTTSLCPIVPMGPDPVNVCVSQCFILHCVCSKTIHMSQKSSSYCVNRWCDQSFVFGSKSSPSLSHSGTAERSFVRFENAKYYFSATKYNKEECFNPAFALISSSIGQTPPSFRAFQRNQIKSQADQIDTNTSWGWGQTSWETNQRNQCQQIRGTNSNSRRNELI